MDDDLQVEFDLRIAAPDVLCWTLAALLWVTSPALVVGAYRWLW